MNNKESALYDIVGIVIDCCATRVDDIGTMSLTIEDVLGVSRAENVVMTRCILVGQLLSAGYSVTTIAQFLHKSNQAIRHLLEKGYIYQQTSRAYKIADSEATLRCKRYFG